MTDKPGASVKKSPTKLFIFGGLTILWTVFCLLLFLVGRQTGRLLLIDLWGLHLGWGDLLYILALMCSLWCAVGLRLAWGKIAKKILKFAVIAGWVLLIIFFLLGSLVAFFNRALTTYYEFRSPDGRYKLVAGETSFLLLGQIGFYERKNCLYIENLNEAVYPDDGYCPIAADQYQINWEQNRVTFAADMNDSRRWTRLSLNLGTTDRKVERDSFYPYARTENPTGADASTAEARPASQGAQNRLDQLSAAAAVKIPGSDYGLVEVDRAGARSLWYFVQFQGDQMVYLSEGPDTAPAVTGSLAAGGSINLTFKDIHEEFTFYQSTDGGRTWTQVESFD